MERARSKAARQGTTSWCTGASNLLLVTLLAIACPGSTRGSIATGIDPARGQPEQAALDCGFYNEMVFPDPVGDGGDDPNVDVVSLSFKQWGQTIRFDAQSNGSAFDAEGSGIGFMFAFDLDRDPATGQSWGGLGADLKIWVWTNLRGGSILTRLDAAGNVVSEQSGPRAQLNPHGFEITVDVSQIGVDQFDLYFQTDGGSPYSVDYGSDHTILLLPGRSDSLVVSSDYLVLEDGPRTVNITTKPVGVALHTVLTIGGVATALPASAVSFTIDHPARQVVSDPETIISVDAGGIAHYLREGYVLASPRVDACDLTGDPLLLATGDVFGTPGVDDVIAIFPSDYQPGNHTMGSMMSTYPSYIALVNAAYRVTRDMYGGWQPFGGDTQIFALLDVPELCGGAGNPLETAPCCYIECNDGSPHYVAVIHEMGHNFHYAPGMWRFLTAGWRFIGANVHECVASLPVIYFANEISLHGELYGFGPGTWEKSHFDTFVANDGSDWSVLDGFEAQLSSGEVSGFFDPTAQFDKIALFCAFFQAHVYGYQDKWTPFGHEMIRRFVNVFDGEILPGFQDDKVETYFAAAFSAAAGLDLRERLRHWGFSIEEPFYDDVFPLVLAKIDQVFSDDFESGDLSRWSATSLPASPQHSGVASTWER